MKQNIKELCKSLRLAYVADVYDQISFDSPEQFLYELFQEEIRLRERTRSIRLIKKAKFLDKKSLQDYEWTEQIRFPPHLTKEGLCSLGFIENKENVVLVGSPGTGKTHLATGLGRKACEMVMKFVFIVLHI
jgi:DNA replication protein DnaC